MDEITKQRLKIIDEIGKLEDLIKTQKDDSLLTGFDGNTRYRYCMIREFSGYSLDDWTVFMEWAKKQDNCMHFTYDEEKDAFYFDATPNMMFEVELKKSGVYICIDDNFSPKIK